MKLSHSSTRIVPRRVGNSANRPSALAQRRRVGPQLEALEERTLLSVIPSNTRAIADLNQMGAGQSNPNQHSTPALIGTQSQAFDPEQHSFFAQGGSGATVTGTVYDDLNGDGARQAGDPTLANWTIDLFDSFGDLVATTTSNASGQYSFANLPSIVFTIEEIVNPGWFITDPTNPPGTYTLTPASGSVVTGLDFGNFKAITVGGNIYNDQDGNGVHGATEPGLAGFTVDLEDSSGNVLATVLTDSSGNYSFSGVGGGTYLIAQVVPTNWVQTQPLYPTVYTFTTQSGQNLLALNFGDHASPALDAVAVIDNGQPGYSENGTWSTAVGGFNATNRVAQTVRGSGHTSTASWSFAGLAPMTYFVYVTFASKTSYATAAPFSVNGSAAQSVNEAILVTQSQGGRDQGSYGGVGWLKLGTYAPASGQLKVVLTNLASGNDVDADGFLLVADGALPHVAIAGNSASGKNSGTSIGTLQSVDASTGAASRTPAHSINTVTKPGSVTIANNEEPPAQAASSSTSSIIGLALSNLADEAAAKKNIQS